MGWVWRLVGTGTDSPARDVDVMEIARPGSLGEIANLGLTLREAKQLLARVQQIVVTAQAHDHAVSRPVCSFCGCGCHIKDWRLHRVATLFGTVAVRLPRFRCTGCGHTETAISWPSHCRSTPELDQLRAHLSALMPYRVAAGVLVHLLPVEAGKSSETLRGHTLRIGEQLHAAAAVKPTAAASAITVTLDSTFIVAATTGNDIWRFASATSARSLALSPGAILETVGRTADTALTAFTDGCPGLQSILTEAGVTNAPIADWFHIAMRLQHVKQAASGLSIDNAARDKQRR
jgi:hypothetical protein